MQLRRMPMRQATPLLLPPPRKHTQLQIRPACSGARLRVVYSTSKQDVDIESLGRLLEAEHCGADKWAGKTKLGRAVDNSTALVAAFVRTAELLHLTGGADRSAAPLASPSLALVGFARASSDSAFAATVHNVIVHPAVRRQGIGRSLLARLTAQLKRGGVTDIGLMAPRLSWDFFAKVDFGEDREVSTPMRYLHSSQEPYVF